MVAGKKKLYTLLWGHFTTVMIKEWEGMTDYTVMDKKQDTIMLIKNIKSITYSFRDHKYLPGSLWMTSKVIYNTIQKE